MSTQECNNRNIPLPIQREVRKRCGFGCVVCGLPLYEYDHLKGWATVHEHVAEDITLLCDQHHREVTSGLLPRDSVIAANKSPYNLRSGVSSSLPLHYEGNFCEVNIGGNIFTTFSEGEFTASMPLLIDNIPLIGFVMQDGQLLLNVNIFDEFNQIVLKIVNNHLFYSITPWDISFIGRNLIIREGHRKFLINILFEPPNKVFISKGRFLCNGVELIINEDYILLTNSSTMISGCSAENCSAGLIVGETNQPIGGFMKVSHVNRYLGDNRESKKWAKFMMEHK